MPAPDAWHACRYRSDPCPVPPACTRSRCAGRALIALAACSTRRRRRHRDGRRAAAAPAAAHAFDAEITADDFAEHVQACWPPTSSKAARPAAPGEEKTVDYLEAQFERLGLKPGNGDSYFQTVPMVETTADESTVLKLDVERQAARR